MDTSFIFIFITTVFIASITPGPSMLLALNHGVRYGRKRALMTACGNVAATFVQCVISFAGLGMILSQSAWIFTIIRYVGAAYLVYLGIRIFLSRESIISEGKPGRGRSLFSEAFVVTMGNPKAIFFFSALFPQFIEGEGLTAAKVAMMTSSILTITFACMMLYAALGDKIKNLFARAKLRTLFNRIIGGSFIGLGVGLALNRK
jgi:homoserine/homoserine lactone efflux protein